MRLVPEKSPLPRLLVFPFGLMALFGFILGRFQTDLVFRMAHCPLRDITGIPCPTCGGTHTAIAMTEGRIAEAWSTNPLVTAGLFLFGIWILAGVLATLFPGLRRDIAWTPREKRTARILAVLVFVMGWIWQILLLTG